jgi:ppGpp synthetase/RelA/SpoT-type nucleotidyltranferase
MMDLQAVRALWKQERPSYEHFVEFLARDIKQHLRMVGIYAEVYGRAKEIDSLIKKLLVKKHLQYEKLGDKAGVRAVVRFRSEINLIREAIDAAYLVTSVDDKTASLQVNEFGYQGLHMQIRLRSTGECPEDCANYEAELQIKTKAQSLWSELNHELSYKTNIEIPPEVRRRLFGLAALLETADREFEAVNDQINLLPNAGPLRILAAIEKQFFKINPVAYSKELSLAVIEALRPLYPPNDALFGPHFDIFYEEKSKKLEIVFAESVGRSVFLSQPEALMIFDLLDNDRDALRERWSQVFPAVELEELARIWGKPLD